MGDDPEPYVRKIIANARVSLWRRRRREVLASERFIADVVDEHLDL